MKTKHWSKRTLTLVEACASTHFYEAYASKVLAKVDTLTSKCLIKAMNPGNLRFSATILF